jgi:hypothetical protein
MAIIYSYPVASAVEAGDLVIGTDTTGKQTKNFTLQSIVDLVPDNVNGTVGTIPVFTGTKAIGDSWIIQTLNPSVSSGKLVYVEGSLGVDASATVAEFFEVGGSANILGSLTVGVNPYPNMPNSHLKAPALTAVKATYGSTDVREGIVYIGGWIDDASGGSTYSDYTLNLYTKNQFDDPVTFTDAKAFEYKFNDGYVFARIQAEDYAGGNINPLWEIGDVESENTTYAWRVNFGNYAEFSSKYLGVTAFKVTPSSVEVNTPLALTDDIDMNASGKIIDLLDPTDPQDAATKSYVDAGNTGQVTGTGTNGSLPLWSDGPNGVLGNSAIKQHMGNNITIGSPNVGSQGNYTLSVGNGNDFASGAARVLAVGNENGFASGTARVLAVGLGNVVMDPTGVVDSAIIGLSNQVQGSYSLTVGQNNQTNSGTSFVAGIDNITSSGVPRQFVIGRENAVDSIDTIVLGDRNIVTETGDGFGSMMVFGHLNDVKGDRILCLGTSNIVNSDNQGAYIIGAGSSSTADRTYSVGQQNAITGNESYAFGKSNTIAASASVAVGTNNSISAVEKAYAFGFGNDNINFKSFAIGDNNDVLSAQRTYLIGRENKPATDNTLF